MSGSVFALIAVLVGALLFITALVVWQEARRRPSYEPLTYVIDDAVLHVEAGLASEPDSRLTRSDIRRILDWEVFYLQGLAQDDRSNPVETVAGGSDASIEFIIERIATEHGVTYSRDEVERVLALEADYLFEIGAVGEPVTGRGGEEE